MNINKSKGIEMLELIKKVSDGEIYNNDLTNILTQYPKIFKYINNPSEEHKVLAVTLDGSNIQYIQNQTFELQEKAIEHNVKNIRFIKNPYKEIESSVMYQYPEAIMYLDNPSDESIMSSLYLGLYGYIKNKTPELDDKAVDCCSSNIRYIKNPSIKSQYKAYNENNSLLPEIKNLNEILLTEIIMNNPYIIITYPDIVSDEQVKLVLTKYPDILLAMSNTNIIKYKDFTKTYLLNELHNTPDTVITLDYLKINPIMILCAEEILDHETFVEYFNKLVIEDNHLLIALYPNYLYDENLDYMILELGWVIEHIDPNKLTNMHKISAINACGGSIRYIKEPTQIMQSLSVKSSPSIVEYIENPTEDVVNEVITKNPQMVKYIKNISEFMAIKAIKKMPMCINLIDSQTSKMQINAYNQNKYTVEFFKDVDLNVKSHIINQCSDDEEILSFNSIKLSYEELEESINYLDSALYILLYDKDQILKLINRVL